MSNDEVGSGVALSEAEADERLLDRLAGFPSERAGLVVAGFMGFLAVWHVAALFQSTYLLPLSVGVFAAFVIELTTPASLSIPFTGAELPATRLLVKLVQSLHYYVPGLLIRTSLGILAGIVMGWNTRVDSVFTSVTRLLRPIPPLAWIGFAVIWLSANHQGTTFITVIGSFWINFYSAYGGVEGVSEDLKEVAAILGVDDDWTIIRKVVISAASPFITTSTRTSTGQRWMIVVVAELIVGVGVDYEILNTAQNLAMDASVAYMLVISIVFLVSDGLFRRAERRVLEWRT